MGTGARSGAARRVVRASPRNAQWRGSGSLSGHPAGVTGMGNGCAFLKRGSDTRSSIQPSLPSELKRATRAARARPRKAKYCRRGRVMLRPVGCVEQTDTRAELQGGHIKEIAVSFSVSLKP
eukprot:940685-Rhodomonas_salina.1